MPEYYKPQDRKWRGHVLSQMEPTAHARTALTWFPEGRRKRGRQRTTWKRTLLKEMNSAGVGWERATRLAQDRVIWKNFIEASCATMA